MPFAAIKTDHCLFFPNIKTKIRLTITEIAKIIADKKNSVKLSL